MNKTESPSSQLIEENNAKSSLLKLTKAQKDRISSLLLGLSGGQPLHQHLLELLDSVGPQVPKTSAYELNAICFAGLKGAIGGALMLLDAQHFLTHAYLVWPASILWGLCYTISSYYFTTISQEAALLKHINLLALLDIAKKRTAAAQNEKEILAALERLILVLRLRLVREVDAFKDVNRTVENTFEPMNNAFEWRFIFSCMSTINMVLLSLALCTALCVPVAGQLIAIGIIVCVFFCNLWATIKAHGKQMHQKKNQIKDFFKDFLKTQYFKPCVNDTPILEPEWGQGQKESNETYTLRLRDYRTNFALTHKGVMQPIELGTRAKDALFFGINNFLASGIATLLNCAGLLVSGSLPLICLGACIALAWSAVSAWTAFKFIRIDSGSSLAHILNSFIILDDICLLHDESASQGLIAARNQQKQQLLNWTESSVKESYSGAYQKNRWNCVFMFMRMTGIAVAAASMLTPLLGLGLLAASAIFLVIFIPSMVFIHHTSTKQKKEIETQCRETFSLWESTSDKITHSEKNFSCSFK